MDISTAFLNLNWIAIIVATISSFVLGGIWYGPLLGKTWMAENGFTEEELKRRNMPKIFIYSFLLSFIAAFNLAMFIGKEADLVYGSMAGFLAGLGWVATFTGIQYLFEMRSLKLFFTNAGYSLVALTIMGMILGGW